MLDKIEREEKVEQKRIKKQESAEEKQKRIMATKLQAILFKQKEALKKEILRKRSLMEKNLQQDIQVIKYNIFNLLFQSLCANLDVRSVLISRNFEKIELNFFKKEKKLLIDLNALVKNERNVLSYEEGKLCTSGNFKINSKKQL